MYLIMQLLVDFVNMFRNFVNIYQQKRNVAVYTCNRFTFNYNPSLPAICWVHIEKCFAIFK